MSQIVQTLQAFRQIICICPCCNELSRLSDINLRFKENTQNTWLDEYDRQVLKLKKKEEKFEEAEEHLRKNAREVGRKRVQEILNNVISPELKNLNLDPYDIKPLLHPADFVVFKGMNSKEKIDEILFLSRECSGLEINFCRNSLREAILSKKYEWKVARVGEDGKINYE